MKQKSLLKTLLLLCALVVGSVSAWAEEEVYKTALFGSDYNSNGVSSYESTFNATNDGFTVIVTNFNNNNNGWDFIKCGRKNNASVATITTNAPIDAAVTKVVVTVDAVSANNVNSFKLYVADNSSFTNAQEISVSIAAGENTFAVPTSTPNCYYKLEVNCKSVGGNPGNGFVTISKVEYYHDSTVPVLETVATPTFDPEGDIYATAQSVSISCATDDADIYYTTNGDAPTTESTKYTEAISVTTATTIKAIAVKSGMNNSAVATAEYTIKPNAPTITAEGSEVTITGDAGCTIYYTTDGSDPSNTSTQYTGPIDLEHSSLVRAIAYDTYGNVSDIQGKQVNFSFPLVPNNINSGYYEKVTDASTLEEGDAILIVNEDGGVAMSTTQNTNNRASVAVTFAEENVIYVPADEVQKLLLVKRTENNVSYFYFCVGEYGDGDGYLYAASKNKNYLKTTDAPDNNARATITIENGDATIQFTGTNSNNLLRYNGTNNPPIFSCYSSGSSVQTPVQIYKEVAHNVQATVTAAEYATFNSKYAVDFSETDITAFTAAERETTVRLTEVTSGQVPANTPVVLYKAGGGTVDVPVIASAEAIEETNDLHVVGEGGLIGAENIFVLAMPSGKPVGFYLWDSTATLNEGKVYLQGTSGTRTYLPFNEATDISENVSVKNDSNAIYDLQGRRVVKAQKGLYIVNGKKVIMK